MAQHPGPRKDSSFRQWWDARGRAVPEPFRYLFLGFVALAGAPVAVLTAVLVQLGYAFRHPFAFVLNTVAAPAVEETTKVLLLALALESKPYMFRRRIDVLLTGLAGAIGFAIFESLAYSTLQPALAWWYWRLGLPTHAFCTLLVSTGLALEWRRAWHEGRRPEAGQAFRWWLAAVILHALYDGFISVLTTSPVPAN